MKLFPISSAEGNAILSALEQRSSDAISTVAAVVSEILAEVRAGGDQALRSYAERLDGLAAGAEMRVAPEEMETAWNAIGIPLRQALEAAAESIRAFAVRQLPESFASEPLPGLMTGQLVRPLSAVGCYVPGGRHPLPSTMLMTMIPAQVAGVGRIVVVSPNPAPETLATAHLLGVEEMYRIGGAQAVAALAYGTPQIARVDKIVGPGNLYVTAAKREVAARGICVIDMLAGPTEIVVTSDLGSPADIASDLVAQAEHDPAALAILITTREELAHAVREQVSLRVSRNPVAATAIAARGVIFLAASREEAFALTNRLAPEHLTVDSDADVELVENAGSIFIGQWSPQPMGDYISGPNHTLPTGGLARLRGGLSVNDFVKLITVQRYTPQALRLIGPQAILLAEAEGLDGHAEAIRQRLDRFAKEPV